MRSRAYYLRPCDQCGAQYWTINRLGQPHRKTCGAKCARDAQVARLTAYWRAKRARPTGAVAEHPLHE